MAKILTSMLVGKQKNYAAFVAFQPPLIASTINGGFFCGMVLPRFDSGATIELVSIAYKFGLKI